MAQINDYALLAKLFCTLLVCLTLTGCDKTVAWQEEVQLSTGETIMIERALLLERGGGFLPLAGFTIKEYHIRFRYPSGNDQLIEWKLPRWGKIKYLHYDESPLVLDLSQDKVWFIYTSRSAGNGCLRYVKYQFQNGVWTETPLSDGLIDVHPTNLFLAGWGDVREGGVVYLPQKNYQLRSGGPTPLYFHRQVGPQQIVPFYKEGFSCVWDPVYQLFNATKHINNQEK